MPKDTTWGNLLDITKGYHLEKTALSRDSISERLRSWTRNPMGFTRRGSNPVGVDVPLELAIESHPSPACHNYRKPHRHQRHCARAAKDLDQKSNVLCPQGFESPRCRCVLQVALRASRIFILFLFKSFVRAPFLLPTPRFFIGASSPTQTGTSDLNN